MTYSIYIPRVFKNIPNKKIIDTFESFNLGKISTIDVLNKEGKNDTYKMVFIHFTEWFDNPAANNLRDKIDNKHQHAKLVYDDPWYWILLPNQSNYVKSTPFVKEEKKINLNEMYTNSLKIFEQKIDSRFAKLELELNEVHNKIMYNNTHYIPTATSLCSLDLNRRNLYTNYSPRTNDGLHTELSSCASLETIEYSEYEYDKYEDEQINYA